MSTIFSPDKFAVKSFSMCSMERSENLSWDIADRSQFRILLITEIFFFTLITNNLALTYSLKYDNANKMRQCENIFVFIDLTKSIGSDLGGQCPPRPPPKLRLCSQSVMDRLLTAGLCGNTIGQDIQTLIYHSSTSNMAFHLKDVCSSNFTWPLNMMLT